jgi:hypothetical protein
VVWRDRIPYLCQVYGSDSTTKELGQLNCGEVEEGEIVTVLEDAYAGGLRVKTADGQSGWASEGAFEVVR